MELKKSPAARRAFYGNFSERGNGFSWRRCRSAGTGPVNGNDVSAPPQIFSCGGQTVFHSVSGDALLTGYLSGHTFF